MTGGANQGSGHAASLWAESARQYRSFIRERKLDRAEALLEEALKRVSVSHSPSPQDHFGMVEWAAIFWRESYPLLTKKIALTLYYALSSKGFVLFSHTDLVMRVSCLSHLSGLFHLLGDTLRAEECRQLAIARAIRGGIKDPLLIFGDLIHSCQSTPGFSWEEVGEALVNIAKERSGGGQGYATLLQDFWLIEALIFVITRLDTSSRDAFLAQLEISNVPLSPYVRGVFRREESIGDRALKALQQRPVEWPAYGLMMLIAGSLGATDEILRELRDGALTQALRALPTEHALNIIAVLFRVVPESVYEPVMQLGVLTLATEELEDSLFLSSSHWDVVHTVVQAIDPQLSPTGLKDACRALRTVAFCSSTVDERVLAIVEDYHCLWNRLGDDESSRGTH
jgi:hypothetical protein